MGGPGGAPGGSGGTGGSRGGPHGECKSLPAHPVGLQKPTFFNAHPGPPTDLPRDPPGTPQASPRDPSGTPGDPQGPPGDPPGTPRGPPGDPPGPPRGSPELLETSKGHPRNPPGPLLAPQLSGQSVPGRLIGYVDGFWDPPTSPEVGLGGVTCSGFGSAASAEGLSIYVDTYIGPLMMLIPYHINPRLT